MPIRAARPRASRLAPEVTSFIGRRRELTEIKRLLETTRLLTLTGAGGCGKTRLALRAAAELARLFPDGVYVVELASLGDAAVLVHAVFQALDFRDQTSAWPLTTLSDYLASKRLLLVLDNCEHLVDACAVMVDALLRACADVRILTTSRQPLGTPGETTYRVPSLTVPGPDHAPAHTEWRSFEAVALFEDRAGAVDPGFTLTRANASAVIEVCHHLDGIPLAIELAAVWVRTLSVAQIAERLDDRFRLLSRSSPATEARHRTLRAALDWSFELLSELERVLWQRLSVFPGSFDLDAAVAVTAGEPVAAAEVLQVLDGLVSKSIVNRQRGEGIARYEMLESVREYGRQSLRNLDAQRELRRRHLNWVAGFVAEADTLAGAQQARWLDLMDREQDSLRAALDFCLHDPALHTTGQLMLGQSWLHWVARGHLGEARRWLTALLEVAPGATPPRARALATLAMVALSGGDARMAELVAEEGALVARQVGDTRSAASCETWQGIAAYMQHDFGRSESCLHKAAEGFTAAGDDTGLASTLIQLGALAGVSGDLGTAEAILERSRDMARRLQDTWLLARSALTQGSLLAHWGHAPRASTLLRESVLASQTIGDRWAIAMATELFALVASAEGRLDRAAQLLGATEALWETAPPAFTREWAAAREKSRSDARAQLGKRDFEIAFSRGQSLNIDQAIRLALEEPEPQNAAPRARRPTAPLSTRELEVAALVAQGLSNKEIAARLIIAERTADTHVNNILTRLGFKSRTQLAAWHTEYAHSVLDT